MVVIIIPFCCDQLTTWTDIPITIHLAEQHATKYEFAVLRDIYLSHLNLVAFSAFHDNDQQHKQSVLNNTTDKMSQHILPTR